MKYNLEHFPEIMGKQKRPQSSPDMLYGRLTADLAENVSSPGIQSVVHEIIQFIQKTVPVHPPASVRLREKSLHNSGQIRLSQVTPAPV